VSRGGESAGKRRVTAQRNDRKAAKAQRREHQRDVEGTEAADESQMMTRFHQLNELRSSGSITEEDFERQRHDIFVSLGLEDP
jgi:hypothetical protein